MSGEQVATKWWKNVPMFHAIAVVLVIVFISLLSKWSESDKQYSKQFLKKIKYLIEQATRLNALAQQDTNPILQLVHCNSALMCAQIARGIAPDKDIESITGIDIHELVYYLEECQSYTIKNLGQQCPKVKIEGVYSIGSGWT